MSCFILVTPVPLPSRASLQGRQHTTVRRIHAAATIEGGSGSYSQLSQSSSLDDFELDKLEIDVKPKNTRNVAKWTMKKNQKMVRKRNKLLDLAKISTKFWRLRSAIYWKTRRVKVLSSAGKPSLPGERFNTVILMSRIPNSSKFYLGMPDESINSHYINC